MTGGGTGVIKCKKGCDSWGNVCDRPRVERGVTGGETGVIGQE